MTPPSRLQLERYVLNDLPPADAEVLRRAIDADETLAARVERLREDLDAIRPEVAPLSPPWEATPTRRRLRWPWAAGGLTLILATATALLILLRPPDLGSGTQFRGAGFDLVVQHARGGVVQEAGGLVSVGVGDRLQFRVEPGADGYVHIFDVQDDGKLQTWVAATPVRAHEPFEAAFMLDDHPGSERVFVVFSGRPVSHDQVHASLSRQHDVPLVSLDQIPGLGAGVDQRSLLLVREP